MIIEMPTVRQKKVARLIIDNIKLDKPLNRGEIVEKSGYAKVSKKNPQNILERQGVKDALEEYGFTIDNAKKVVSEIMLNVEADPNARLKATDQVFKVKDAYAATKSVQLNLSVSSELKTKGKQAISEFLNDNTRNS